MKRTKLNNKGFSLVELIIVIAIMAILAAALAPQLMKYIEKSRVSTDDSTIASIENSVNAALGDEAIYKEVTGNATHSDIVVIIKGTGDDLDITSTPECTTLNTELEDTFASIKEPKESGKVAYKVTIDVEENMSTDETPVGLGTYKVKEVTAETVTSVNEEN